MRRKKKYYEREKIHQSLN